MEEENNQNDMPTSDSDVMPKGKPLQKVASKAKDGIKNAISALWRYSPLEVKIALIVIILIFIIIIALLLMGLISENSNTVSNSVDRYVGNIEGLDEGLKSIYNDKKSLLKFKISDINNMYNSFIQDNKGGSETISSMQYQLGTNNISTDEENERIVNPDDKLPAYKHILLTEKYNFNMIKWNKYSRNSEEGKIAEDSDLAEDKLLGLKYPKDNANTNIDTFINMVSPYLQTWYIPLAMNSASLISGTDKDTNRNPDFAYNIIKEAYSNIVIDWRDLQQCQLTTTYETYTRTECKDVAHVEVKVENGKIVKKNKTVTTNQYSSESVKVNTATNNGLETGTRVPSKESVVVKNIISNPTYYISLAETFDTRIINTYDYKPYSDSDVNNLVNADSEIEEVSDIQKDADGKGNMASNQDAYIDNYINEKLQGTLATGGNLEMTYYIPMPSNYYTYSDGKLHTVVRTWQDKVIQKESKTEKYTVNDVVLYNQSDDRKEKVEPDGICGEECAEIAKANREIQETGTTSNPEYAASMEGGINQSILSNTDFTSICNTDSGKYYRDLQKSDGLNRIDLMNSNPEIYKRYLASGSEYLDYVGYSRSKLSLSYWELKDLLQKIYDERGMLPWIYGQTLGFEYNAYGSSGMCGNVDLTGVPPDGLAWPVEIEEKYNAIGLSSLYGPRWGTTHDGLDIVNTVGQPEKTGGMTRGPYIVAAHDGIVTSIKNDIKQDGYKNENLKNHANYITIRSNGDNPITTGYWHLSEVYVKEGDSVTRGQRIGRMGNTGYTTGMHLHLYVWKSANKWVNPVDPLEYYIMNPPYPQSGNTAGIYRFAGSKSVGLINTPCTEITLNSADLANMGLGTKVDSADYTISSRWIGLATKWANKFGLDPYLVIAMICTESSGDPMVEGAAIGLMQWEKRKNEDSTIVCKYIDGTSETINYVEKYIRGNPDRQIQVGCAELRNRLDSTPNLLVALQGYNYGPSGIKRCITYYISNGQNSDQTYCGISDDRYNEYVRSGDNGWLSAREWYSSEGHKKFKGAGGGTSDYVDRIMKFYNPVNGNPYFINRTGQKIQL